MNLDPYESASIGVGESHNIEFLINEVEQYARTEACAVSTAVDAICEGFELPATDERALRDHFGEK